MDAERVVVGAHANKLELTFAVSSAVPEMAGQMFDIVRVRLTIAMMRWWTRVSRIHIEGVWKGESPGSCSCEYAD